ncbi:MAG TPA: NIL domain-containing protein [Anaerolineales bacterium]|nr:NIL domain-containing protein [Anaerolineales bacterium]
MVTRNLRLNYPPILAGRPILQDLIRSFDLELNVRQAQITLEEGWLEATVEGAPEEIESAIAWLENEGVKVDRLGDL